MYEKRIISCSSRLCLGGKKGLVCYSSGWSEMGWLAVAQEDGMVAGQPLSLPLTESTNARAPHHRDLFPFHGWCHHRFGLVVVLPLVGQAVDR